LQFKRGIWISIISIVAFLCIGITTEAKSELIYHDSAEEVVLELREGMKNRKETIEVGYVTTKVIDQSIIDELMQKALMHTGVPTEGDYLRGHYKSYKASAKGTVRQGVYKWVFIYNIKYATTAKQEKEIDKVVGNVLSELSLDGKDSYTKTRAIYDYICENVQYDWKHVNDNSYTIKHTAYAAAVNKTAVCQGYSLLLYRMLLESGVDNRVIEGVGNGKSHSWNIVKIAGSYYCLDATWDSSNETYKWFLKGRNDFKDHKADSEFNNSTFTKKYPIAKSRYWYDGEHKHEYLSTITKATFSKDGKINQKCWVCGKNKNPKSIARVSTAKLASTLYIYNGKVRTPRVIVKDKNGKNLVQGKDYNLSYSSGRKYVGKYNIKISLKGTYSGTKTLEFTIKPKQTKITSLTAGKKSYKVQYSKCTTQTTGYQIQYSTSEKFTSGKSVYVNNNTIVFSEIKGLKSKKTYYVRVRTYKKVKVNGKNTNIYSEWSSKKSIKTK